MSKYKFHSRAIFPETSAADTTTTQFSMENISRAYTVKVSGGDTISLQVSVDGTLFVEVGSYTANEADVIVGAWPYIRVVKTGTAAVAAVMMAG